MKMDRYDFASDNAVGMAPAVAEAVMAANAGAVASYGDDALTERACRALRDVFETDCEVFFVFNGTAANALAISALCRPHHALLAHAWSHVVTDECAAVEFFTGGTRVTPIPSASGKLDSDSVRDVATRRRDLHASKPAAISLTQATEVGALYAPEEIQALTETARGLGMRTHMDGARFANAVAGLGRSPADLSWRAGVDVLSLGGTKIGGAIGDAVIFFDRALAYEFEYRCKQTGQLASKMRFVSAAWDALLRDGLWLDLAKHANGMARSLRREIEGLPGVEAMFPTQANGVFMRIPPSANAAMAERGWHYYDLLGDGGSRLMCSWATEERDVSDFVRDLRHCLP